MATLVLTAVGNYLGGPIGGSIGAAICQQVDRAWLMPGGTREGPRLKELEVQTSSYGTAIPAIFGAMRVAGTVIWATDLIESSNKQGNGKGRQSTVEYSYSVSLAVALSSRPVLRVGRIWADGNLLRGAAGDLKVETIFRLHNGYADQLPDPLLASAEAAGQCPAYRGFAYAVFEDLQLATFGNRIPQLTFEIFEREGAVGLADIAATVMDILGECSAVVDGYALVGESGRAALTPLIQAMPVLLRANGHRLELLDWPDGEEALAVSLLAHEGSRALASPQTMLAPANDVPAALSLSHYDPARDYQLGMQRSHRGGAGRRERQIDVPASLSAEAARGLAESQLLQAQRSREGWTGHIPMGDERLRPGDLLAEPTGRKWRIDAIEHGRGVMRVEASGAMTTLPQNAAASPGRAVSAPDQAIGETRLVLADLPAISGDPDKPMLAAFAAGTQSGWRRAALSVRQGLDLVDSGATAAPAIFGQAEGALGAHSPLLVDTANAVVIELLHAGMTLPAATGSPLDAAAPLCLLGNEYLRYGSAEALGQNRYRLSQLLRGCYGSENAIAEHNVSESFLLIEAVSSKIIDDVMAVSGQTLQIEAMGLVDNDPAAAEIIVVARAITPLPPVHFNAHILSDGGIGLQWQWRSRIDFGWQDGVDQPCPEITPLFAIRLLHEGDVLADWQVGGTEYDISPAELAAFGLPVGTIVQMEICQIGRFARSASAILDLSLTA